MRIFAHLILLSAALVLTTSSLVAQGLNTLTPAEQAQGWKLLFDGKSVPGLRGLKKPDFLKAGWTIDENALVLTKTIDQSGKPTGGDLVTAEPFNDFEFSFEWKLPVSSDSGILYIARGGADKPIGMEFQLVDDVRNPESLKGGPIRRTGALDRLLPPSENKRLNDNNWNHGRLLVKGNHVEHWINGAKVLEYELGSPQLMQAIRESGMKVVPGFGFKLRAPLVILDQGEEVAFRNLKIRHLTPPPPTTAPTAPNTGVMRPAPAGKATGVMR